MTGCVFASSSANAALFNAVKSMVATDCLFTSGGGHGCSIQYAHGAALARCAVRTAGTSNAFVIAYGSTDISLVDCVATTINATYAVAIYDGCQRVRVIRGVYTVGGISYAFLVRDSDEIVLIGSTLNTASVPFYSQRATYAVYGASAPAGGTVVSDNMASGQSVATAFSGSTPYLYVFFPNRITDTSFGTVGITVYLTTKDAWLTTDPLYVPGLASYGATTLGGYALNGATVQTQYRVSHDNGRTWTEWADLPATITDTPDRDREYIQFRVRKTDSGTGVPYVQYVRVTVAFAPTWQWKERPEGLRIQAVEGGLG
jgi:hypothetical protein